MKDNKDDKIYNKVREIEFRGKRKIDNTWIYGGYMKTARTNKIQVGGTSRFCTIYPETLGQFTGLCDKDGKKIYEGDIVEFETNVNCITSELKPYWKDCYEKQYALGGGSWWVRKDQAIVQWNSKDGMWDLKVYNNGRYKRKSKLFTFRDSDYVVVGNIYDNPELLGG